MHGKTNLPNVPRVAAGELNSSLPMDDLDSIRKAASWLCEITFDNLPRKENFAKNNAETNTDRENQPGPVASRRRR